MKRLRLKTSPLVITCLLVAPMISLPATAALASSPVGLARGFSVERELQPSAEHVYVVSLDSGAALIAKLDQKSVDVAVDVYDPKGDRIEQIDQGDVGEPERVTLTAYQAGTYRLVVHPYSKDAELGRYVLQVDDLLAPADNATRLARLAYPVSEIFHLWQASLKDPSVIDTFVAEHDGKPIIEASADGSAEMRVTYYCVADDDTDYVLFNGGPDALGMRGHRLGRTNFFFVTQQVPRDARFGYGFNYFKTHLAGPNGEVATSDVEYGEASVLTRVRSPSWWRNSAGSTRRPWVATGGSIPDAMTSAGS